MPLAARPLRAVLTKLSSGKLPPVGLRAQRRSGRRVHATDRVLTVAAEAVHVEPLPALIHGVGHEQAVPHGVPRRRRGRRSEQQEGGATVWRARDRGRGHDAGADQAAPHEMLVPHVRPSLSLTVNGYGCVASSGTLYSFRIATISARRRSMTESSCAFSSLSR